MQMLTPCESIRVTLVEDNDILRMELVYQLQRLGYQVKEVEDAKTLDALILSWTSDIYILDVNLPGENGFSIAQRLANRGQHGIIMLTARTDIDDKVNGLEQGADLYLTKPIDLRELNACIKSLYRRLTPEKTTPNWVLNLSTRCLFSKLGKSLDLTGQEIKVLELLLKNPGQCINRKQLVGILDINFIAQPDYRINTVIFRLRHKLCLFDSEFIIHTSRGDGYALLAPMINIQSK